MDRFKPKTTIQTPTAVIYPKFAPTQIKKMRSELEPAESLAEHKQFVMHMLSEHAVIKNNNLRRFIESWKRNYGRNFPGNIFAYSNVVYEVLHYPSNDRYIGETSETLEDRMKRHICDSHRPDAGRTGFSNRLDHEPDLLKYIMLPIESVANQSERKARETFYIQSKKPSLNHLPFSIRARSKNNRNPIRLRKGRDTLFNEPQAVPMALTKNQAFLERVVAADSKEKRENLFKQLNVRRVIQIGVMSSSAEIKEIVQKVVAEHTRLVPSLMLDVLHPLFTKALVLEAIRRVKHTVPWKQSYVIRTRLSRTFFCSRI